VGDGLDYFDRVAQRVVLARREAIDRMNSLIGPLVGAVLSLIILSYLIGDNFFYRILTHVLVGAGAAYIVMTVLFEVIVPKIWDPVVATIARVPYDPLKVVVALLGLLGCALLLLKAWPRLAAGGNIAVGYLVGVGAAVALGGALFGTFSAQIVAAAQSPISTADIEPGIRAVKMFLGTLALVGTLSTLISFGFYRVARGGILSIVNALGRFFLAVSLGATFALVYVSSASLLIDRVQAIATVVNALISGTPKP
jgi:hypothetical protein